MYEFWVYPKDGESLSFPRYATWSESLRLLFQWAESLAGQHLELRLKRAIPWDIKRVDEPRRVA